MFNLPQYETREQRDRRVDQWLMQLDVDVKRLWGAVPQTVDQIGGFPVNPAVFQVSSSSSSSSEESGSGSSSSESDCPQCVAVTISGMTGDCALANGVWNVPHNVGCDLGSPHYALTYTHSGSPAWNIGIYVDYIKDQDRWTVGWDLYLNPGHSYGSYISEVGVGIGWGGGTLTRESGCVGSVSITPSLDPCPESSSSSSSSESSSSSSSSEESTSEASMSEESSSSGASSSEESSSEAPSSSEEATSESSPEESSSGASSGAASGSSSGSSSEGGDPCATEICSSWQYDAGEWNLVTFDLTDCEAIECTSPLCSAPPDEPGYQGLFAYRHCDGSLSYGE